MPAKDGSRHISLLRGINVGGHHKVSMGWLREAYEQLGCTDVTTYLQSGNVVYQRDRAPAKVGPELTALIEKDLGFRIEVLHRTHAELTRVLAADTWPDADPSRRLVVFLAAALGKAQAAALAELATEREELVVGPNELQLHCPDGIGRSKLAEAVSGQRLKVVATARNWRTVSKLAELSAPTGP